MGRPCISFTNDSLNSENLYHEYFRFTQMHEMNLLYFWNKIFQPEAHQCLLHNKKKGIRSLSFNDLGGAFTVLLIGSFCILGNIRLRNCVLHFQVPIILHASLYTSNPARLTGDSLAEYSVIYYSITMVLKS